MSLYAQRGVSAQKEDVHAATKNLDAGLYPNAFCRLYPDLLGGDKEWVNVMHADGAGTKAVLAYLWWKETGDISVWKGIAQDAIVMNLDDLLCVGISTNLLYSSSIDRNKHCIPGEVLKEIIEGTQSFFEEMADHGVKISFAGGETADVGDVVRTIAVNGTMAARWRKKDLVTNEKIAAGQVIVGLAGYGLAGYEKQYNSGIGSNGLTSARHDVLDKLYKNRFPESFEPALDKNVVYIGAHTMTDEVSVVEGKKTFNTSIGKLLLSPTRTFAPVIRKVLEENFDDVYGLIHCSGGGQTKCLKYVPDNVRIVKDRLFDPPYVFQLISESSGASKKEMYQVFNMGCRMEVYTNEKAAQQIIGISRSFGVDAQVIGYVEAAAKKELFIGTGQDRIVY